MNVLVGIYCVNVYYGFTSNEAVPAIMYASLLYLLPYKLTVQYPPVYNFDWHSLSIVCIHPGQHEHCYSLLVDAVSDPKK